MSSRCNKNCNSNLKNYSELHSEEEKASNDIPKERYISPEKRQQMIDELRLV